MTQYVELFEWCVPGASAEPAWNNFSAVGNNYISFTVKDLAAVVAEIKSVIIPHWPGTRLIQDPPMQFPLRGEVCTSTFLVSPWGMWIELTQWSDWVKEVALSDNIIGKSIFDLPTPALLVDLDRIDNNLKLMQERLVKQQQNWCIPCKVHKCPELARYFLNNSCASSVLLLTLAEVRAFANAGIKDIYLANQVTFSEIEDLALIAKQLNRLRVAVDDAKYVERLAIEVNCWEIKTPIEINVNHHRCGVDEVETALALAKQVIAIEKESGALHFAGITGYEGHTLLLPAQQKRDATYQSHALLAEVKKALQEQGIKVEVVTGGGSCNYIECTQTNVLTEIQAGGGILCDALYYEKANLKQYGHAMGIFY